MDIYKQYRRWLGRTLVNLNDCRYSGNGEADCWTDGELLQFHSNRNLSHVERDTHLAFPQRLYRNALAVRAIDLAEHARGGVEVSVIQSAASNTLLCAVEHNGLLLDFPFPQHVEGSRTYFLLNVEWVRRTDVLLLLDSLSRELGHPVVGRPTVFSKDERTVSRGDAVPLPRHPDEELFSLKVIPAANIKEYHRAKHYSISQPKKTARRKVLLCVPPNIDDICDAVPDDLKPYRGYVHFLLSTIRLRWSQWQADEQGFVRLNVEVLRDFMRWDVERQIRYWLIEQEIIIQDTAGCGNVGWGSYKYKVNDEVDAQNWKMMRCPDKRIEAKIVKHHRSKLTERVHRHLHENLFRFTLNLEEAERVCREIDDELLLANAELQFTQNMTLCELVAAQNHHPTVCGFGRFHSLFTRLHRRIRSLVTIDGHRVAFADVRNSQPLLVALISLLRASGSFDLLSYLKREEEAAAGGGATHPSITLLENHQKSSQDFEGKGVNARKLLSPSELAYLEDCEQGIVYEELMGQYPMAVNRDQFKELCYRDIYYGRGTYSSQMTECFQQMYPATYGMIQGIRAKSRSFEQVNHMMQRLESELMIKSICERIRVEHPAMPILTVHDAIGSLPENLPVIVAIMKDEYGKVGLNPSIKRVDDACQPTRWSIQAA